MINEECRSMCHSALMASQLKRLVVGTNTFLLAYSVVS